MSSAEGPATDPLSILSNPPSTVVKIHGTARDDVNGQLGIAVQFSKERGRYMIHMVDSQTTMALKPTNINKASTIESYKAQAQQVYKDPRIRREFTRYYNVAQSKLGGVKPEYAAVALALLVATAMYFVGFSQTVMVISMLMMLGLIIGPDIANGASSQVVAKKFPRRCRETIEQSIPFLEGKLNDYAAAVAVVLTLAMAGRSLLISPERAAAADAADAAAFAASDPAFDEAAAADPSSSRGLLEEGGPLDYRSWMPTIKTREFGIRQAMSLIYIWRTVKGLGTDETTRKFDPQVAWEQAKLMDPWKIGILGFSVYNLVKTYLW